MMIRELHMGERQAISKLEEDKRWKINHSVYKNIGHSQYSNLECPEKETL